MQIGINVPFLGNEEILAVISILKSGLLTSSSNFGGKHVQNFEKHAASFVKSKYAIAVNSGTAALQSALYALNINKNDEVLIPSFTFLATANAVASTGAKPIFVDIIKDNYTIDPADLEKKITKKTKAIIPVHLYGNVALVSKIAEIAKKHNLAVIEDAAQSLGSSFKNKNTGTFFEMGCFSLYPTKVITAGEGGFIVTNSKKIRDNLLMIRNHGIVSNDARIFGLNFRMPEINAAIASIQMKKLPKFLDTRRKNASLLSELISDLDIKIPVEREHEKVNWSLYTINIKRRNMVLKKLHQRGIGAAVYYSIPIHKTHLYSQKIRLSNTEYAASRVLSLPIHQKLKPRNIEFIAQSLREILNE